MWAQVAQLWYWGPVGPDLQASSKCHTWDVSSHGSWDLCKTRLALYPRFAKCLKQKELRHGQLRFHLFARIEKYTWGAYSFSTQCHWKTPAVNQQKDHSIGFDTDQIAPMVNHSWFSLGTPGTVEAQINCMRSYPAASATSTCPLWGLGGLGATDHGISWLQIITNPGSWFNTFQPCFIILMCFCS